MRRWMALAAWAACAVALQAHDLGRSESAITVHGSEVRARLLIDLLELQGVDVNHDGLVSLGELDDQIDRVFTLVKQHFVIMAAEPRAPGEPRATGEPLRTVLERYTVRDGHVGELDLLVTFKDEPTALTVTSTLHEVLQPANEHVTSVSAGDMRTGAVLDAAHAEETFVLPAARSSALTPASSSFDATGLERPGSGTTRITLLLALCLLAALSVGSLVRTALRRRPS